MFRFLCAKVLESNSRASPFSYGYSLSSFFIRPMSEMSSSTDPVSFTASYLQNACGFPPKSAILAARKLVIKDKYNPDSVLELLKTQGLTQTQIRKIIASRPGLLLADVEDKLRPNVELFASLGISSSSFGKMLMKDPRVLLTDACKVVEFLRARGFRDEQICRLSMKRPTLYLLNAENIFEPKISFFKSLGFTDEDLAKLLSSEPYILERSLENHIIPNIQVLRRILGPDENVIKAMKGCYWLIECDLEKFVQPNISMMLSHGVPMSLIVRMFLEQPRTLVLRPHYLNEIVTEVLKFGFVPSKLLFFLAIRSLAVSKTLWEQKLEAYGSFGLSKEEIYSAFRMQPLFMLASEKKIKKLMDFFINKMNIEPQVISKYPNLLMFSLEKRIIPRCSVLQLLISAGLLKKDRIIPVLFLSKKDFVEKVVKKYQDELPDIVKAHRDQIEFQGFPVLLKTS
ncbi:hypothetical protein UlMin_007733 [Ulmus minor]